MFIFQFVSRLLVLLLVFVSTTASRECTRFRFSQIPCRKKCCGGVYNERLRCSRSCVGFYCSSDEDCDGGCCRFHHHLHYGRCKLCWPTTSVECTTYHDCFFRYHSFDKCCYEGTCYDCGKPATRFFAPPTTSTMKSTSRHSAESHETIKISVAISGCSFGLAVVIAVVSYFNRRQNRVIQSSPPNTVQRESTMQSTNAPQYHGEMVPNQDQAWFGTIRANGNVNAPRAEMPPFEIEAGRSIGSSLARTSCSTCGPVC